MKLLPSNKNAGIALIVVMIAIAGLSVLAIRFAFAMKIETRLAINADSEQQMLWLGRAGVETARWLLAQELANGSAPYDSLDQVWAGGQGGPGETNSVLSGFSLDNIPVGDPQKGGGTISLKIIDCERMVNINTASPMQIQQVLTVMGVSADRSSVVVDSIENWVNPEIAARPAGAESDYYQGLIPPYYAKNAPMDDLSELLLVKGVTWNMYNGGGGDDEGNQTQPVFHNKLGFSRSSDDGPYPFGLKDVFTPISTGRININTADANVLQSLPGVDAQIAQDIINQRNGLDGGDGTPYRNVGQLQAAGLNPQVVGQMNQLCDVRSHTFEVHITAQIGSYQREYVALLLRNSPSDIQVVGFYWINKTANGG